MSDAENPFQSAEITLSHLTKKYDQAENPAVNDISMTIPAGKLTTFVGPSGCGKTTTLRMINRLVEATSGKILIGGKDVSAYPADMLRRHIGYAIQRVGLLPHLTVGENIAVVPKLLKWPKKRVQGRVEYLLDMVGLDPSQYMDRSPGQLSGGQQQRVGVARALAADPPVLLMDEPFGAVDPVTRTKLQKELLRIQAEVQKTVVFVTHDIDEALLLGDMIAVFGPGSRLEQFDTPEALLRTPASKLVSSFIGGGATLKLMRRLTLLELLKPASFPNSEASQLSVDSSVNVYEAFDAVLSDPGRSVAVTGRKGDCVGWIDANSVVAAMNRINTPQAARL
ncbi:ABC transporter ATP-binding protein [Pseudarthrobacter sp. H2]|uniref:ABC transporter ATP-binding protein n=1 Tax=Pseudarthrobacter sp. H2 TaxID=3418415 RepID=UPI003CEC588E